MAESTGGDLLPLKKQTLADMLDATALAMPHGVATVYRDQVLFYNVLRQRATALARGLIAAGLKTGERVAVWMPNCPEWIIVECAVAKVGGILVPMSTHFGRSEVEFILRQSGSRFLFTVGEFLGRDYLATLQEVAPELAQPNEGGLRSAACPDLRMVIVHGAAPPPGAVTWERLAASGEGAEQAVSLRQQALQGDDLAYIQYTSGSTGAPKGCLYRHRQIIQNAEALGIGWRLSARDRALAIAPFFHVLGHLVAPIMCMRFGCSMVIMDRFDPGEVCDLIAKYACTTMSAPPALFEMILRHPQFTTENCASLRAGMMGGAPPPAGLAEEIVERMGLEGIMNGYGSSESCGGITLTPLDSPAEVVTATVGPPLPGVKLKIVDINDGSTLPPAQVGEIYMQSSMNMDRYFNNPEETERVIDADGWLHLGDLGALDAKGNLRVTGRLKDMYISAGNNVYPIEVEAFLLSHPEIAAAQVVGVPDDRLGETGMAYLIVRGDKRLEVDDLVEFASGKIAKYKLPKHVRVVNDYPMTGSGKVSKTELRQQAITDLGLVDRIGITHQQAQ